MPRPDFTIGNAVLHIMRAGGPKGFVLRFALFYGLLSLMIGALSLWLQWPLYEVYLEMVTEGEGDFVAYSDEINAASMRANLVSLLLVPVSLGLWVIFEAASQRRYMRGDGFSLRLGADEGRMAVVGLIWVALLIAAYIVFLIPVAIVAGLSFAFGGAAVGIVMMIITLVAGFVVFLWLFARLSPAGALTIRDQQIRFFEAWRVTKGRAWPLFWAYFVLFLIVGFVVFVLYAIAGGVALAQFLPLMQDGAEPDAAAVMQVLSQPSVWGPAGLALVLNAVINGVFVHALGGPAALAAKHDPAWVGPDSVPEVFA